MFVSKTTSKRNRDEEVKFRSALHFPLSIILKISLGTLLLRQACLWRKLAFPHIIRMCPEGGWWKSTGRNFWGWGGGGWGRLGAFVTEAASPQEWVWSTLDDLVLWQSPLRMQKNCSRVLPFVISRIPLWRMASDPL